MLAQCWLKRLVLHRHTRQVWILLARPVPTLCPWTVLVTWLKPNVSPSPVFEGCPKKLFDLEDTYWSSFCIARYFPETWSHREPGAYGGHCEVLCGTVAQMSLCVALWVLHHLQTPTPGPTAGGFGGRSPWYTWPNTEPIRFLPFSQKLLLTPSQPYIVPMEGFPGPVRPLG